MKPWWEFAVMIPAAIAAGYLIIWAVPGTIMSAMVSFGDSQRIVFIDRQLSKDVRKLHSDWQCMMSYEIGTRFMCYCIAYPFIRHRATTKSVGFRIFMWVNSLGYWSFVLVGVLVCVGKVMGIELSGSRS